MRFHLIDRIIDHQEWKAAKGLKNITKSDDLLHINDGDKNYSLNLLCESIFQTLAWLIVKSSNQTKRPVVLSIKELSYFREVLLLDKQVITEIYIEDKQEDIVVCSGKAYSKNGEIIKFTDCFVSLLDTTELEDSRATQAMLDVLYREE